MDDDSKERIRRRAYQLWEQNGRPDGGSDAFWLRAEHELESGSPVLPSLLPQVP
jgi:hypothetical protein